MSATTEQVRFWSKVEKTEGCWIWKGGLFINGYGRFYPTGGHHPQNVRAHRYAYQLFNGPIPEGLQIDHLCRNRRCVKPSQMEAVTQKTNLLRGTGITAENARKTTCHKGHPLTGDNLILRKHGWRWCKTCYDEAQQRRKEKQLGK
jgi:hypothetical protein